MQVDVKTIKGEKKEKKTLYTKMFIVVLFTMANRSKQPSVQQ
jgi:hypothetical protein